MQMLILVRQRLRLLVTLLGLVLSFQGGGALVYYKVLEADPDSLVSHLFNSDTRHALIHLVWGVAIVASSRLLGRDPSVPVSLAVLFGSFYTLLGVAGLLSSEPFGMSMRSEETGFHLIVGPLVFLAGLVGLAAGLIGKRSASSSFSHPKVERS